MSIRDVTRNTLDLALALARLYQSALDISRIPIPDSPLSFDVGHRVGGGTVGSGPGSASGGGGRTGIGPGGGVLGSTSSHAGGAGGGTTTSGREAPTGVGLGYNPPTTYASTGGHATAPPVSQGEAMIVQTLKNGFQQLEYTVRATGPEKSGLAQRTGAANW